MSNKLNINIKGKKLFIDGSYFVFYRFFATSNWFKIHNTMNLIDESESLVLQEDSEKSTVKELNVLENPLFIDKYKKSFERTIVDLVKKNKIDWNNVFFAKDCPRYNIWRNKYIDGYKATRDVSRSNQNFNGDIFTFTYNDLLPNLMKKYRFHVIQDDQLEADDVIAIAVRSLQCIDVNAKALVITNDNDYIQLLTNDNIEIFNLQCKNLMTRNKFDDAKTFLEVKIILGDKSDNIPSIGAKIGPKTAIKLAKDPVELAKYFEKNPASRGMYDRNKMLIDFDMIEEDAQKVFKESLVFNT